MMPLSETELHQMSYREVVELAKTNGVYNKKSAKKAALIRRLSSVWTSEEVTGVENVDPNRTEPLATLLELDESVLQDSDNERRKTFTKVKKGSKRKTTSGSKVKSTELPKRQNTFTKCDSPDVPSTIKAEDKESNVDIEKNKEETTLQHESTFKITPEKIEDRNGSTVVEENGGEIKALKREGTFTKTPDKSKDDSNSEGASSARKTPKRGATPRSTRLSRPATGGSRRRTLTSPLQNDGAKNGDQPPTKVLVREGTFTKTPEKKLDEIPLLQVNTPKNNTPLEKMSVFQRLSLKIPLTERRSLASQKRTSLKTSFYTPQSNKKAQLQALREGRQNHENLKSVTKKATAHDMKTPARQIIKPSTTSTKKSSVKKLPDFAEIHKRTFAKMESLMDNKKRLQEKSELLSRGSRIQTKSAIPVRKGISSNPPNTSGLNKTFGNISSIPLLQKKMTAKDRLKIAKANKCSTGAVMLGGDKKLLKGVRTNRRFELQLEKINKRVHK